LEANWKPRASAVAVRWKAGPASSFPVTHSSYLIRCWLAEDGCELPISIEHIQTGTQCRVADLTEAAKWMDEVNRQVRTTPPIETEDSAE
jgi:hypothetical protein